MASKKMKQAGIHWAIKAQMARRGGFQGGKVLTYDGEVDGLVLSFSLKSLQYFINSLLLALPILLLLSSIY